jgi:hypothetical protein
VAIAKKGANEDEFDIFTRIIHLGLVLFGLLAWLASIWAGDYKRVHHLAVAGSSNVTYSKGCQ